MRQQRAARHRMHGGGHIGVHHRQQGIDALRRLALQRSPHARFAAQAVGNQAAQHVVRPGHQKTVAGRQPVQLDTQQSAQRRQIRGHVAVGRVDDDGGALHHVVAGEQRAFFFKQVTQVVGRVARRVQHTQRAALAGAGQGDAITVLQLALGREKRVLPLRVQRRAAPHRRAGGLGQRHRAGRMVAVGVGDENLRDGPTGLRRRRQQRLGVRRVSRAGVDDGETRAVSVTRTHQVGIGARPGHRPGVRGCHAPHAGRQTHRHTGLDVAGHVATPHWVQPGNLGIGPLVGQHHARAVGGAAQPRHRQADVTPTTGLGQCVGRRGKARQVLQRAARHGQQFQATLGLQGGVRRQPHQLDRLGVIGHGCLTGWRQDGEKARVEALGHARWREPVAVVRQAAQVELHRMRLTKIGHRHGARLQLLTPALQRGLVHAAVGQQQAHLFERLAHGGHPVVQPAVGHAQAAAGPGIVGA